MSAPQPAQPESPFTPRKEFVRDIPTTHSSFSLLAISSSNCIRLYSFDLLAVASLRRLLEHSSTPIISSREDAVNNLYEFALDAKPWANPKSVATEKLLVQILAVIYQCGYSYLSTIDYGREPDDRLIMTFSKPSSSQPTSRNLTPLPSAMSHNQDSSTTSIVDKPRGKRVPFALSFSSVTVMRVISPPLHLTPAILQSVRSSWPRGVVSEKKVGDDSYEFKLKGYRWFQEDTFATDSLVHILSLLTSLDSHSFTLLTSISLTNRSRVKDLWIFTGPVSEDGPQSEAIEQASDVTQFARVPQSPNRPHGDVFLGSVNPIHHRRVATDPHNATPHPPPPQHTRATTESPQRTRFPPQPQVLRKPAPRAQIPVSVVQDSDISEEPAPLRTFMPSTISTGVENMTGIGANPKFSQRPPRGDVSFPSFSGLSAESADNRPLLSPSTPKDAVPSTSSIPFSPHKDAPSPPDSLNTTASGVPVLPPLLGIGAFRDSAFSINSEVSREVPIKWTGPFKEELRAERRTKFRRTSNGPDFPGGWQPSPIREKTEDEARGNDTPSEENKTPVHEILSHIGSPSVVRPDMDLRRSETAVVGMTPSQPPPGPIPVRPGGGAGWVLIDVENGDNTSRTPNQGTTNSDLSTRSRGPTTNEPETEAPIEQPSETAKAIVIMDAMDTKHKKSQSTSISKATKEGGGGGSGVRRFFSLSRKNSRKVVEEGEAEKVASNSTIPRSNLRDRLRRIGTPEASRREDKRRSID